MKNFAIEIRWAIIAIAPSVFWIFLEKSLGLYDTNLKWQPLFSMLIGFAVIPLYYFAIRDKKEKFLQWRNYLETRFFYRINHYFFCDVVQSFMPVHFP